jgi:hypothetical protein
MGRWREGCSPTLTRNAQSATTYSRAAEPRRSSWGAQVEL